MPAMIRKSFYFDERTDRRLGYLSRLLGIPRAAVLRSLVDTEFSSRSGTGDGGGEINTPAEATTAPYAGDRKEALG